MRSTTPGTVLLLACLYLLSLSTEAFAQPVRQSNPVEPSRFMVNQYSTKNGLPGNYASLVYPSSSGYLWSASTHGLSRFDGERIITYNASNTVGWNHANNITLVCEDQSGAIWFDTGGKKGKGLYVFNFPFEPAQVVEYHPAHYNQHFCFPEKRVAIFGDSTVHLVRHLQDITEIELPAAFINNNSFQVQLALSGTFWLAGNGVLVQFREGAFQAPFELSGPLRSMSINKQGELLVATDHDIYVYQAGELKHLRHSEVALKPLNINHSTYLWFNQPEGVWQIDGETRVIHKHPMNRSSHFPLRNVFEADGRVFGNWMIADFETRLFELTEKTDWKSIGLQQFGVRAINDIRHDREGGIWVASDVGVFHIVPRKMDVYTILEGVADRQVFALGEDKDNNIWVGAWGDGIQVLKEHRWTYITEEDGLLYNHVMSFEQGSDGAWLVGTNQGLSILRDDRVVSSHKYTWPDTYTSDLLQDSRGQIWVATFRNLFAFDAGQYTPVWPDSVLKVKAIFEDKDGALWAGTESGAVKRTENGTWKRSGMPALDSLYVKSIMQDIQGALWFATEGGGLIRKKENLSANYTSTDGLPTDLVHYTLEDDYGHLWIGTDSGLLRIRTTSFDSLDAGLLKQLPYRIFTEEDGMPNAELISGPSTALKANDGRLWVATIDGVAVIDPANLSFNTQKPELRIQKFIVQGESQALSLSQRFRPGPQNTIVFEFATLSLRSSRRREYKYRLLGQNDAWRTTRINEAKFTSLKPGVYTFEVAGSNNDGYWSEVEQFDFVIAPVYHQSVWFRGLLIGLLAGVVGLGYRQMKINGVLQEALTRNRIADDLHDDIGSKISAVAQTLGYICEKEEMSVRDFEALSRQARNARELVRDLRDSVWIVDAAHDKICDLVDRMEQFTDQIGVEHDVSFSSAVDSCETEVEMEWRRNVYLLYKEAVTNIVRHAKATEIQAHVVVSGRTFSLVLRDNGVGFQRAKKGTGRGQRSMKRRATAIKGDLTFSSNGDGTMVQLNTRIA
ncbi:MAG: two-component regulator propeller domain-containing protein [Bacteroidota bacterium]